MVRITEANCTISVDTVGFRINLTIIIAINKKDGNVIRNMI